MLTAVTDAVWEADLVGALERTDLGVSVVRRCVDLADLLATAATGTARVALLSADLRRLDRDALTRLAAAGVAVVGLFPPGEEDAERRLRQLGVGHVLPSDADAVTIAAAVVDAVATGRVGPAGGVAGEIADPRTASLPDLVDLGDLADLDLPDDVSDLTGGGEGPLRRGIVVAVWGPTGAPGRTTIALGVATEAAAAGTPTLLIDADVYGAAVGQALGLLEEAPGLAAATRMANNGTLDVPALADLARAVTPGLRVLTGITRADRWPEIRPSSLQVVIDLARRLVPLVVVDCAFCLELDEELAYDTAAPRRNGATLTALETADTIVAVTSADPVGLHRFIRAVAVLRETLPGADLQVVVNRLRASAVPGDAAGQIRAALKRYAGLSPSAVIPLDVAGCDTAVAAGRSLVEAVPRSPARLALGGLAGQLLGVPGPRRRRLLARR